jgi:hypothetical protein
MKEDNGRGMRSRWRYLKNVGLGEDHVHLIGLCCSIAHYIGNGQGLQLRSRLLIMMRWDDQDYGSRVQA